MSVKIAFWSEKSKAGTTFNMAAVACAAVMLYPISAAVAAGGYEDRDLENHFKVPEQTGMAAEEDSYFLASGLDLLLRKSQSMELTEHMIKANMHQIVPGKLYCLPGGKRQYEQWWDKADLFQKMEVVLKQLEGSFDVVFIDCGCRKDDFTRKVLEEADVCVLNMQQEAELIGSYYKNRMKLKGKVFFLVGSYFGEALYNRKNLQRIYRLEEKELGAVPYNVHLQSAGMSGRTDGYIKDRLQHRNLEFEEELKRTTRLIMQMADVGITER